MSTIFGDHLCADPVLLAESCARANPPIPTDRFWGKANTFRVPIGRGPGRGHILLTKSALDALDTTTDHTLTFSGSDRDHVVSLSPITLLSAECVDPGSATDPLATYLCEVVDRRHHLAKIPVDKAYNVRTASGEGYRSGTLNGGAAWTWQQVVTNLSNTHLGIGTLTLPFTPDGTPESLSYWAPYSAWDALCDVLDRLACAVEYDPEANTFAVVRLGSADATSASAQTALSGERLWDGYDTETVRGWRPQKVRVVFPRLPVPEGGTTPVYTVDVTLTATTGVASGTHVQLWDDAVALAETGTPSNSAALATRAAERAADWLRKRGGFERPLARSYRDFVAGADLLGSTIGRVSYDDRGGPFATMARAERDGRLESWRPLAGAPASWPPTELDGKWKEPVRAKTPATNLDATYANGLSGVGATLTANPAAVLPTIDGITLVAGDRVLVADQTSTLENGIYVVTTTSSPWVLTRATDMDEGAEFPGAVVLVKEGTTTDPDNKESIWTCIADAAVTVGTTAVEWWPEAPLQVGEVDGSPLYRPIINLLFDSADGFVVTQPSAWTARVDIGEADGTLGRSGIMSNGAQTICGPKTWCIDSALTNTTTPVAIFRHHTSGTATTGFGHCLVFYIENGNGASVLANQRCVSWLSATHGAEIVQTIESSITNGAMTQLYQADGITGYVYNVPLAVSLENAVTAAVSTVLTLGHNSTGTPAASFGSRVEWKLETTTTADTVAGYWDVQWTTATHASRTSKATLTLLSSTAEVAVVTVSGSGGVAITSPAAAAVPVAITAHGSQSGDLFVAESSGGTDYFVINKDGYPIGAKTSAPADGDLSNSEYALYMDATAGAAALKVKLKDSGGTVTTLGVGPTTPTWVLLGTVTHADLTDADGVQDVTVYTAPAKAAIHALLVRTKTAGSGGGVGTVTVMPLVNGADAAGFTVNGMTVNAIVNGDHELWTGPVISWAATTTLALRVAADVNVVDLTGGEWELYGMLATLP